MNVPNELVGLWASRRDQQVVGQAELLPILLAAATWGDTIRGRPVIVFIDNDSARFGMISGYSPVEASARVIHATWVHLAHLGCRVWFSRVPSASNIADGPSRAHFEAVLRLGAVAREPSWRGATGHAFWKAVKRVVADDV